MRSTVPRLISAPQPFCETPWERCPDRLVEEWSTSSGVPTTLGRLGPVKTGRPHLRYRQKKHRQTSAPGESTPRPLVGPSGVDLWEMDGSVQLPRRTQRTDGSPRLAATATEPSVAPGSAVGSVRRNERPVGRSRYLIGTTMSPRGDRWLSQAHRAPGRVGTPRPPHGWGNR